METPPDPYGRITEPVRSGDEPFCLGKETLPHTLLDFWRWTGSLLLNNTSRGNLAEFIVAQALGIAHGVRATWDSYDLKTARGLQIEVKSSAYVQAWRQKRLCRPTFGIAPAKGWDPETNVYSETKRHAHVYVFCLLDHKVQATINPLDLTQWTFYVLPTHVLDAWLPTQKSVGVSTLERLGAEKVAFDGLAAAIQQLEGQHLAPGAAGPS